MYNISIYLICNKYKYLIKWMCNISIYLRFVSVIIYLTISSITISLNV